VGNHLTLFLLQHPRLAGLFGFVIALAFGALGVSSLIESRQLPDAPTVVTMAQFADALKTQDPYWAIIPNPQWDCSTLVHTKVGEDTHTEVFVRDPKNSVALLVTYIEPMECADLNQSQAVGVVRLMSEKYVQHLEQEGRLAPFRDYRTLAYLCTTCGKQNSTWLLVISAIFVVIGLGITYPLVSSVVGAVTGWGNKHNERLKELRNYSIDSLEQSVYRYETEYFKVIGEDNESVQEFRKLIETKDILTLHKRCRDFMRAFQRLETKTGYYGPPLIMDYYADYEIYVQELYNRKTDGVKQNN
jgi:hypothetical protein